jgi:hypothetical protein
VAQVRILPGAPNAQVSPGSATLRATDEGADLHIVHREAGAQVTCVLTLSVISRSLEIAVFHQIFIN